MNPRKNSFSASTLRNILISAGFACLVALTGNAAVNAQDLPLDPSSIDQLTPEQRQRALELMGQDSSGLDSYTNSNSSQRNQGGTTQGSYRQDGSRSPRADDQPDAYDRSRRSDRGDFADGNDFDSSRTANARDRRAALARDRFGNFGGLKPFGYDLFSGQPDAFRPTTDIPIPTDYVLGPGDVVRVQMFGSQNGNYSLPVNRDGRINFPKLGPIDVAGQHFDDVRALIEERVSREMIGVQTSVTLGELRSIRVFVLGDVNNAGSYTVSSLSTITNALLASGGIAPIGSLRKVELKRGGRTVQVLDLYDLLLRGDSTGDVRLLPGDVIFIPPVGPRVSVDGEVKRPAVYELKNESTVAEMFKLAGGLLGSTNTATAQIERFDRNQKKTLLQLNVESEVALGSHVQDGDVVRVRRVSGPFDNNVRAMGAVRYPGSFEWSADSTLQKLLIAAQLLPSQTSKETYLPIGLIERTSVDSGIREFVTFNVQSVMSANATPVPLQRNDLVIILNRKDVGFLDSSAVRSVAAGDLSHISTCPGLQQLADVVSSDRPIRLLKAFSARSARSLQERLKSAQQTGELDENYNPSPLANPRQVQDGMDPQQTNATAAGLAAARNAQPQPQLQPQDSSGNTFTSSGRQQTQGNRDQAWQKPVDQSEICPELFVQVPRALPFLLEESVAVYGEVRQPGIYPIADNTPIDQVVQAAGGLSSESDPRNVEYVSYADAIKSRSSHYQTLDISGDAGATRVNPGDVFNFKPVFLGQEIGTVRASGEFKFPGSYGILKGERLSELMRRAGGLTSSAYPFGAVFTRDSTRKAEGESFHRAAEDLQQAMVTAVTSGALGNNATNATPILSSVVSSLEHATPVGRVVIEADPTVLEAKPQLDPILEPGDLIVMPKRPISVTVIGQVLNPGTIAFTPGLTVKQYIERAGGYSQAADSGRAFVILPNGSAQRFKSSFWNYEPHEIPPGSEIVVPRDAVPFNGFAFSERIFGILSSLAITAASLSVISRN
ncbi:MAG: polysaccharide export protein [Nevskia sp.]|nr:polysaccharide export protein [Nevskia sp.]